MNARMWWWGLATAALVGCGRGTESAPTAPSPAVAVAPPSATPGEPVAAPAFGPALKPFRDAVVHDVPEGEHRPPDQTATGKAVGKIYEQVAGREGAPGLFDQVRFVDSKGRKIVYQAVLKTDLGDVRIELLSDSAPNHVRSFVALARAGYYDGLTFHRSTRNALGDKLDAFVEAGCPLGTGEAGYGSVGYWLRPEVSDEHTHDEGMVGAWHGIAPKAGQPGEFEDVENAAAKFYVTLTKSPWRDQSFTIFGKTVQGLDVAHKINGRPNRPDANETPQSPVVIRQVLIEERLVGAAQIAQNER